MKSSLTPNFERSGVDSGCGRVAGSGTSVGDLCGQQNEHAKVSKTEQNNVSVVTAEQENFSLSLSMMPGQAQTGRKAPESAPIQTQFTSNKKVLILNTDSEDSGEQSGDRKRGRKWASSRKWSKSVAGKDPVDSDSKGRSKSKAGKGPAESNCQIEPGKDGEQRS